MRKSVKRTIWVLCVILFAYIIFVLLNVHSHSKQAKLVINVIPKDSIIKIDGKVSSKSVYVTPGRHNISASKTGFSDDVRQVDAKKGTTTTLYMLPNPVSATALKYLSDNPDIQQDRELYGSKNSTIIQASLMDKFPIVKDLPRLAVLYTIDYGKSVKYPNDPTQIALYITSKPANRPLALQWIKDQGYSPSSFEIIYGKPKNSSQQYRE